MTARLARPIFGNSRFMIANLLPIKKVADYAKARVLMTNADLLH